MAWPKIKTKNKRPADSDIDFRRDLIARAQQGDEVAFRRYRKLNDGLFEKIVLQYARFLLPHDVEDLRQEGEVGLMKGISNYKVEKANRTKPEGYVFSWVRAYVANFARTRGYGATNDTISIHAQDADGEENNILEFLGTTDATPEVRYQDRELEAALTRLTHRMPENERIIATRRTLADEPETLESIGASIGVSRERVRQIELDLKRKLRRRVDRLALTG